MGKILSEKFISEYKEKFTETFVEQSKKLSRCILSENAVRTLAINIYDTIFILNSKEKFHKLLKKALESNVDFSECLTKSMMILIKDYVDHLITISPSIDELKRLIEHVESYLVEATRVQREYIEALRKESEKAGEKAVKKTFMNVFSLIKEKQIPVKAITFFKQVPVACNATVVQTEESGITLSLENCSYLKAFYESKITYLKISNAPKPVKAEVIEFHPERKQIKISNLSFEEIPQEKRKYVRVEPEESFSVVVESERGKLTGIVADISIGGIGVLFHVNPELLPGNKVKVSFPLDGKRMIVDGEVRYITEQDKLYRMGIQFHLKPKEEEAISEYIMRRQFEILKELKAF
ncbi:PilZ domain-containing protein [Phorcysia thermohydrogeniphila]|uniref:PilZ domain-containing protein n=1 Tax=Phorcysia thermohydrogeniphila TaxID=936138 RepID=A0A4R1GLR3_9BACT|nr:PilZ domain-containing protein [Phorcysia thermohydrogeniphila]TCK05342.1 PilZ domain-containing protein [Phorcysia thermohydrogeniphila]